jgi:hypothetical protein
MCDSDDVVAQPEREEQLGGMGHEADDPHLLRRERMARPRDDEILVHVDGAL